MNFNYTDCTSKTLNRLKLSDLDEKPIIEKSDTPSLSETKVVNLKIPYSASMKVSPSQFTIHKKDATCDAILENLKKYGVCTIKNLFSVEEIDAINNELNPFFEEKKNDPRLFPKETIRVTNTVSKCPIVVNKILSHPLNLEVTHKTLDQANAFWIGDNLNIGSCPAIVSSSIAFQVSPNAAVQAWHRDDQSDHNIRKSQTYENYSFNAESQIGFSVALTKTTKENGATRIIPGSHLWDHLQKPDQRYSLYNEMEKGDATFMLSSLFHSASSNTTKDEIRRILILFMGRGMFRPKENIYLNADLEYFKQFTIDQLERLGFGMSEPYGNMVELQDPLTIIKPEYSRTSNYTEVCKVVSL